MAESIIATYSGRLIESLSELVEKAENKSTHPGSTPTPANFGPLTIAEVLERKTMFDSELCRS